MSAKAHKKESGVLASVTAKISANVEISRTLLAIYAEKYSRRINITRNGVDIYVG